MNKNFIFLFYFVLLAFPVLNLSIISQGQTSQNDANSGGDAPDAPYYPLHIDLNTKYQGQIGNNFTNSNSNRDNRDYYELYIVATGNLSVSFDVTNEVSSSLSYVTISKQGRIICDVVISENYSLFFLVIPISHSDSYQIGVESVSDYVEYEFEVFYIPGNIPIQSDAGTIGDASVDSPKLVDRDTPYTGTIGNGAINQDGYSDYRDVFIVTLPNKGYLNTSITTNTVDSVENFKLSVNTINSREITSEYSVNNQILESTPIGKADDYQIVIESNNWNASYMFILSFSSVRIPVQNDSGTNGDVSNNFDFAKMIELNSSIQGSIGEGFLENNTAKDYSDLYRLDPNLPSPSGNVSLTLRLVNPLEAESKLFLFLHNFDDYDSPFPYISLIATNIVPWSQTKFVILNGSNYFLEIFSLSENVQYEVNITYYGNQEILTQLNTQTSTESPSGTSSTTQSVSLSILLINSLIIAVFYRKKR